LHIAEHPAPGGQNKMEYSSPDHPAACITVLRAASRDLQERAAVSRLTAGGGCFRTRAPSDSMTATIRKTTVTGAAQLRTAPDPLFRRAPR